MPEFTYELSADTVAAIATLVEAHVVRESARTTLHGHEITIVEAGARMVANASLYSDARPAFLAATHGVEASYASWVAAEVRRLVAESLSARVCQCSQLPDAGLFREHIHTTTCRRHYEADVPRVGGLRLCADCQISEIMWRRTHG